MLRTAKRDIDMTHGPLFRKIVLFVLPLMCTNLLQVLYNAADMMVVSLSREPNAVGAISTTGSFINLVLNIFMGFSVGTNVVVARHLGAKDRERTEQTIHTSLVTSFLFGVLGGIIGILSSRLVLGWMGVEENLLDLALVYTKIYFICVPFLALNNCLIAIFRAKGDTKTPLIVLSASGALNAALNLFFVKVCDMSVDGVAIATAIANAVSMFCLLFILMRDGGPCHISLRKLRIERRAFADIFGIGLPAGIQGALFSLSNMIIMSSILRVDSLAAPADAAYRPVVGGNGAAANLEGFAYTATNSVYQAAITFTGQNMGAEEYGRVKRVMACCYAITFAIAVFFGCGIVLLRRPLLALYGVHPGEAGSLAMIEYEAAQIRMYITMLPYFLLAFMEIGSGVLRGLGHSMVAAVVALIGSCVLRIIWIYTVFRHFETLASVYISYPLSWALTAAVFFICCAVLLRHLVKAKEQKTEDFSLPL